MRISYSSAALEHTASLLSKHEGVLSVKRASEELPSPCWVAYYNPICRGGQHHAHRIRGHLKLDVVALRQREKSGERCVCEGGLKGVMNVAKLNLGRTFDRQIAQSFVSNTTHKFCIGVNSNILVIPTDLQSRKLCRQVFRFQVMIQSLG